MIDLRKDNFTTGLAIGVLLPVILYFIVDQSYQIFDHYMSDTVSEKLQLLLFAINAVMMRQFMVKRGQDNIGKGILLITMIMVIAHFIYYYTSFIQ